MPALVISVTPERFGDSRDTYPFPGAEDHDLVITQRVLESSVTAVGDALASMFFAAMVIRTLPNESAKCGRVWMHSNPPYFTSQASSWLVSKGCRHVLVDLPSVDRTDDGGLLDAHRTFFRLPNTVDIKQPLGTTLIDALERCTVTELCFVPDHAEDGPYMLHLGIAPFGLDAAPCRPVLSRVTEIDPGTTQPRG